MGLCQGCRSLRLPYQALLWHGMLSDVWGTRAWSWLIPQGSHRDPWLSHHIAIDVGRSHATAWVGSQERHIWSLSEGQRGVFPPLLSLGSVFCPMHGSALPCSPGLYLRMRSQMALRAYGSTPAVGSSKITARDPPTKAMATDSFLFMPPERVCTKEWRLLESSRSSIILGTGTEAAGCWGWPVPAGSMSPLFPTQHLQLLAVRAAQLQPDYERNLSQPNTPSFQKHLLELQQG